jgi:hypothetical protein
MSENAESPVYSASGNDTKTIVNHDMVIVADAKFAYEPQKKIVLKLREAS